MHFEGFDDHLAETCVKRFPRCVFQSGENTYLNYRVANIRNQSNSYDCGLHAIANCFLISANEKPHFSKPRKLPLFCSCLRSNIKKRADGIMFQL